MSNISRKEFIRLGGLAALGLALNSCKPVKRIVSMAETAAAPDTAKAAGGTTNNLPLAVRKSVEVEAPLSPSAQSNVRPFLDIRKIEPEKVEPTVVEATRVPNTATPEVRPTVVWSNEFTNYPPEGIGFKEMYTASIFADNDSRKERKLLEIPVGIAVGRGLAGRESYPIRSIRLDKPLVDLFGRLYLEACWVRLTELMGNREVSFDEYVSLLRQKKGGELSFRAYDESSPGIISARPELCRLDPRQGYSVVVVSKRLPMDQEDTNWSMYLGESGKSGLFSGLSLTPDVVEGYYKGGKSVKWGGLALVGTIMSNCLNYVSSCPEGALFEKRVSFNVSPIFMNLWKKRCDEVIRTIQGDNNIPCSLDW